MASRRALLRRSQVRQTQDRRVASPDGAMETAQRPGTDIFRRHEATAGTGSGAAARPGNHLFRRADPRRRRAGAARAVGARQDAAKAGQDVCHLHQRYVRGRCPV